MDILKKYIKELMINIWETKILFAYFLLKCCKRGSHKLSLFLCRKRGEPE